MVGTHQVIGTRLARCIGRVRRIRRRLLEQACCTEAAVHFVGRNVKKAKVAGSPRGTVATRALEHLEGTNDVGFNEVARAINGPVDMALGGKIHDPVRPVVGIDPRHRRGVRDVADHELAHRRIQPRQALAMPSVGQLVEHDDPYPLTSQRNAHEVRADEAGAASYQNCPHERNLGWVGIMQTYRF